MSGQKYVWCPKCGGATIQPDIFSKQTEFYCFDCGHRANGSEFDHSEPYISSRAQARRAQLALRLTTGEQTALSIKTECVRNADKAAERIGS